MTNSWCDQAEGGMNTVVGKKMVSILLSLVDRLMTWQNAKLYGTVDEKRPAVSLLGPTSTPMTHTGYSGQGLGRH